VGGALGGRAGARWLIAISATTPLAAPAFAGAWTLPAKSSHTIATVSHTTIDDGDMWRTETLTESGVGGGFGLNFKVENEKRFTSVNDDKTGWRVGLQKSFAPEIARLPPSSRTISAGIVSTAHSARAAALKPGPHSEPRSSFSAASLSSM
jgi:hypothetical protein